MGKGSSSSDSGSSSRSSGDTAEKKKKKKEKKKAKKRKKEQKEKEMKKLEQKERIREQQDKGKRRRQSMAVAAQNPFDVPKQQIPPPPPGCTRVDFGYLDQHLGLDIELNGRKGAVVRKVASKSAAEKKGMTKSCTIQALNGETLPTSVKKLEEILSKRPLCVDFLPAPKEDKKDKKEKKKLLKAQEAETKRREEVNLQNRDASLQNSQKEGSSLAGRASKAEEKSDSSEKKDSPPRKKQRVTPAEKTQESLKELRRLAHNLMDSEPGSPPCNEPIALKLLTKQQNVAWQWRNSKGVMQYPIPIGSNKPLSPFSDTDL